MLLPDRRRRVVAWCLCVTAARCHFAGIGYFIVKSLNRPRHARTGVMVSNMGSGQSTIYDQPQQYQMQATSQLPIAAAVPVMAMATPVVRLRLVCIAVSYRMRDKRLAARTKCYGCGWG
jgi:hypothetical protein